MSEENKEFRNLRGTPLHIGDKVIMERVNVYHIVVEEMELPIVRFTRTLIIVANPQNGKQFHINHNGVVRGHWDYKAYPSQEFRDITKLMNHLDKSTKTIREYVEVLAHDGRFDEANKLIESLLESFNKLNSQ